MSARSAYVPLQFGGGEAFKLDWSEERLVIGGIWRKVMVAHMKLCASRAFWLVAYPGQGHEMLFDAHLSCLTGLGGVPRRGIYDNMKTAVDKTPLPGRACWPGTGWWCTCTRSGWPWWPMARWWPSMAGCWTATGWSTTGGITCR